MAPKGFVACVEAGFAAHALPAWLTYGWGQVRKGGAPLMLSILTALGLSGLSIPLS